FPQGLNNSGDSSAGDEESSQLKQGDKKSPRSLGGRGALYSYNPDGTLEKIFEKSGLRFIALSPGEGSSEINSIIIGTDKDGGFYDISLKGENRKFTGLGEGKFARIFNISGENYCMMLDPSRVIRL